MKNKYNLNILIKDFSHKESYKYYNLSRSLIFPSLNETLGIPLFEAKSLNMPILCSKNLKILKNYKHIEYFDPMNYDSIVKSVIKYLNKN